MPILIVYYSCIISRSVFLSSCFVQFCECQLLC